MDLLLELERGWFAARRGAARRAVAGRRRHSRAPAAVDLLAAAPLLSATTLARALGMSVKSALALLEDFVRIGVTVEVSGRSARRLFGLRGLAPLAAAVAPAAPAGAGSRPGPTPPDDGGGGGPAPTRRAARADREAGLRLRRPRCRHGRHRRDHPPRPARP
jgi:hypothetical protein